MNRYKSISVKKAIELGQPDLRGKSKNGKLFNGFRIHKTSGNIIAVWVTNKQRQDHKKRKKERGKKYQKIISRYKVFCGCRVCGYNKHPVPLHLNHKDPSKKISDVSQMLYSKGWTAIKEEVRKCDVLCANCHAIHSYEERHWKVRREES